MYKLLSAPIKASPKCLTMPNKFSKHQRPNKPNKSDKNQKTAWAKLKHPTKSKESQMKPKKCLYNPFKTEQYGQWHSKRELQVCRGYHALLPLQGFSDLAATSKGKGQQQGCKAASSSLCTGGVALTEPPRRRKGAAVTSQNHCCHCLLYREAQKWCRATLQTSPWAPLPLAMPLSVHDSHPIFSIYH